jgi:ABC-type Zn uptake system ZnuABC Zn-binding protein ZnuA
VIKQALLLFLFGWGITTVQAADDISIHPFSMHDQQPKIVVSIEPLYEVLATLSHGVATPEVVYTHFNDIVQPLSKGQKKTLLDADIIIRVGKGFEPFLDKFLQQQDQVLQDKVITLSLYIPLLEKEKLQAYDHDANFSDRQASSDLRFWMDPRLLKMLTDYIAPTLATMDPIHNEEYLDNEVVLKVQLKKIEKKMLSAFRALSLEQKFILAQFNPYLKNRYLSFSDSQKLKQISLSSKEYACLNVQSYSQIPLNLEYTEKTLATLLQRIKRCSDSSFSD